MYTYIVCAFIKVLGIYIDGSMCFRQSIWMRTGQEGCVCSVRMGSEE